MAKKPKKQGDASAPPPNDESDRQAAFVQGIVTLERLNIEASAAKSEAKRAAKLVTDQKKAMRKDGFGSDDVEFALMARQASPASLEAMYTGRARIARWLMLPIGHQLAFGFDSAAVDRTPAIDKARELGKLAAFEGKPNNPAPAYEAGTPQGQAWMAGFGEGQDIIAQGFKEKLENGEDGSGMTSAPKECDGVADENSENVTLRKKRTRKKKTTPLDPTPPDEEATIN